MASEPKNIDVFFYGLFMDEDLLRTKDLNPRNRRLACLENYALMIGARATLVPEEGSSVHGVLFTLTQNEIDALYSDPSVSMYRPEEVTARTSDGNVVTSLCFNLSTPPGADERNPEYAAKLKDLARRIGLPQDYVDSIE